MPIATVFQNSRIFIKHLKHCLERFVHHLYGGLFVNTPKR